MLTKLNKIEAFRERLREVLLTQWGNSKRPPIEGIEDENFRLGYSDAIRCEEANLVALSTESPDYQQGFLVGLSERLAYRIPF